MTFITAHDEAMVQLRQGLPDGVEYAHHAFWITWPFLDGVIEADATRRGWIWTLTDFDAEEDTTFRTLADAFAHLEDRARAYCD